MAPDAWEGLSALPDAPSARLHLPSLLAAVALAVLLLASAWFAGAGHARSALTIGAACSDIPDERDRLHERQSSLVSALQAELASLRESHAAALSAVRDADAKQVRSLAQEKQAHSRAIEAARNATQQVASLQQQLTHASRSVAVPPLHPRASDPALSRCASDTARHAFIFYGLNPTAELVSFVVELSEQTNFGVYVVPDNVTWAWSAELQHPRVRVIRLSTAYVISRNFSRLSAPFDQLHRSTLAMDKAMLLARAITQFGEARPTANNTSEAEPPLFADALPPSLCRSYCRVWLIEDDALIPSVQSAVHVNARTAVADLVTRPVLTYHAIPEWMWWPVLNRSCAAMHLPSSPAQWRQNMCNALAMSAHYCRRVHEFAQRHGRLMFSELWLATAALQWGQLHVESADLLLEYRAPPNRTTNYTPVQLWHAAPSMMAFWHPMKSADKRWELRRRVQQERQHGKCSPPAREDDHARHEAAAAAAAAARRCFVLHRTACTVVIVVS